MRGLLAPRLRRGRSIPSGIPRIDWTHPIARGLKGVVLAPGIELLGGTKLAFGSSGKITSSPVGAAIYGGASGGASATAASALKIAGSVSIFVIGQFIGTPANNVTFGGLSYTSTNSSPFQGNALCTQGSGNLAFQYNNAGTLGSLRWGSAPTSGLHSLGLSAPAGGTVKLYKDAVDQGAATQDSGSAFAGTQQFATSQINISGYAASPATANFNCALFFMWARALGPGEVVALHADPTQFLIFSEDELFAVLAGMSPLFLPPRRKLTVLTRPILRKLSA